MLLRLGYYIWENVSDAAADTFTEGLSLSCKEHSGEGHELLCYALSVPESFDSAEPPGPKTHYILKQSNLISSAHLLHSFISVMLKHALLLSMSI